MFKYIYYIQIIRKLIDEYAADETGQADYALEANGKLIIMKVERFS